MEHPRSELKAFEAARAESHIIGSTLAGNLYERQSVDTYQAFTNYDFSVQTSLDDASLTGLDAFAVQARVDTAMTELQDKAEAIFGKKDEEETEVTFTINKSGPNNYTDKDAEDKKTDARDVTKTIGLGLFGKHLGYAPEMKSDPDLDTEDLAAGYKASVLIPGTGETGRLIGWYQYYSMRASKGWAEQNLPFYSQKIYDDRNSWIKSPTLKDVAMTGVGIAATLATGGMATTVIGAIQAAAITAGSSILTDAAFTAADVGHGADAGQAWGAFGKRAAITGITTALTLGAGQLGVNQAINGVTTGMMGQTFGTIAGNVIYQTGMAVANKAVSTTINAINWEDGHLGFDEQGFASQWDTSNMANFASIAMAATSAGVSSTVNAGGLGFLNGKLQDYNQIGNMAGTLASAAVGYEMTGEAVFNVANLRDFVNIASMMGNQGAGDAGTGELAQTGAAPSYGLLELHIGGANGFSMNLGQGGADVGYSAWSDVARGLSVWQENARINERAREMMTDPKGTKRDMSVAMRSGASGIDAASTQLYDDVMAGKARFRDDASLDAVAKSETIDGMKTIWLGNKSLGGGVFDNSVLWAHEAGRNGIWDGSSEQTQETRDAVMNHMGMASAIQANYGTGLSKGLAMEAMAYQAFKSGKISEADLNSFIDSKYDSSEDFWRLTKDGKLVNDNKAALTIELADGSTKTIGKDETSVSAALVHYLGADRALELLKTSGQLTTDGMIKSVQDVLGVSAEEAKSIVNSSDLFQARMKAASQQQRDQLLGEALMKGSGMSWNDATKWGGAGPGFALSNNQFDDYSIGMQALGNGKYQAFTVTGEATRSMGAFGALSWTGSEWQSSPTDPNRRNTTISFTKRDLNGNVLGSPYNSGTVWNSVDVGTGQFGTADQPYNSFLQGRIQSNTVNTDALWQMFSASESQVESYGVQTLFRIIEATTIGGERINSQSVVPGSPLAGNATARWLGHPTGNGWLDGCFGTLNDVGFTAPANYPNPASAWKDPNLVGSGAYNFQQVTNYLKNNFGAYNGMNIKMRLQNQNPFAWTGW